MLRTARSVARQRGSLESSARRVLTNLDNFAEIAPVAFVAATLPFPHALPDDFQGRPANLPSHTGAHAVMSDGGSRPQPARVTMEDPGQRVGPVAVLPGVLRELGVDPDGVLAECGLAPHALDDPGAFIPFATVGMLLAAGVRRTGCDHLGLLVGQRLGLAQMGSVGALGRLAATVGDALTALSVHLHLNTGGAVAFLTLDGQHASFAVAVYRGEALGLSHFYDAVAHMIFNAMRELAGTGWRPGGVLLARSRPVDVTPYARTFPAPLTFDAEYTGVVFPAADLACKLRTADPARFASLEAELWARGRHSLVNDLRRALRVELLRGHLSADRAASILAFHRRTLHRRLADAGTTFQSVLDEVRYDAARHYLALTDMPLVGIGATLGYSELSAFARAFRRWSGTTPQQWRDAQRRIPPA